MARDLIISQKELVENPTPRVPICLVLDCSPSMSGKTEWGSAIEQTNPSPIEELNNGVQIFFDAVKEDDIARYSAEVSIVAFSEVVETILDFDSIVEVDAPILSLETTVGGTDIGKATDLALNLLDQRKNEYKDAGVDYFQPWLVIMTDGYPTVEGKKTMAAAKEVASRASEKKLTVFPIGIGEGADLQMLSAFSPNRPPLKLKGLNFKEFFEWLSKSVVATSQSTPGENVPLDTEGIKGWGEL